MKKIIFLMGLALITEVYARSSGPGGFYVADHESNYVGSNSFSNHESISATGFGRIMSDYPGSFDIGGFEGIRTIELPTNFEGKIGGRF